MTTPDQHEGAPGARRAWLADAALWFAIAVIGMLVVFAGLAVDAYRHNNGAGEESLLSLSNPGHLIAAIGLAVASAAVLAGLSVSMLSGNRAPDALIRRFVPVTAAWVAVAAVAVGSLTYIGASGTTIGHSHDNESAVAGASTHTDASAHSDASDAGVAQALQQQGIATDPGAVPGALTQGASGTADGRHDHGKHATFTQLEQMSDAQVLGLFPPGTVDASDLPKLKEQVEQVRQVALKYPTIEAANAAGYANTTSDVPFMGMHFLNFDYVSDGVFDPSKPEGLLYSKIDGGPPKLVGAWFLLLPGLGDVTRDAQPAGFAGDLDLWHAHLGLCLVGTSAASEGETKESCESKGGSFTGDLRWMMHVWILPEVSENPDGFFAYLNSDLFSKQQAAAKAAQAQPSGVAP